MKVQDSMVVVSGEIRLQLTSTLQRLERCGARRVKTTKALMHGNKMKTGIKFATMMGHVSTPLLTGDMEACLVSTQL
jgi:hypothetical protein